MDRYARFLCFINRFQSDENVPSPRPLDYNTRMLRIGIASPYFIWPNVNAWRAFGSVTNAVLTPGTARDVADADPKLNGARQAVKEARQSRIGIFDSADPLRIEAFEVRYLSRASGPSRWVIDMSENDDLLIHPENYHTIPLAEDRLYVPSQYVPLFVEAGWRRRVAPA